MKEKTIIQETDLEKVSGGLDFDPLLQPYRWCANCNTKLFLVQLNK